MPFPCSPPGGMVSQTHKTSEPMLHRTAHRFRSEGGRGTTRPSPDVPKGCFELREGFGARMAAQIGSDSSRHPKQRNICFYLCPDSSCVLISGEGKAAPAPGPERIPMPSHTSPLPHSAGRKAAPPAHRPTVWLDGGVG